MTIHSITSLARIAAISMAVALPAIAGAAGSAYADDAFGGDPATVRQSAQSAIYANPNDTPLARATAAAEAGAPVYASSAPSAASDAPKAGRTLDLNGQGGSQDQLGREIYHPGSGTDW